ncbi:hypothetical protein [Ancylobacter lacus]|uniref:hypothetical protein n=1 Tax=Ancylobacter lacus TaxID=2579970 RepID=UPI001BCE168C|nr:hypothetical protein [Ancylobacter lacus]MBS7539191.1 hypothetical protein [Ancylobacter lacus]
MSFSADWLALREPADNRARSAALAARLAIRLGLRRPLVVVDLGAGTGANLRALAPHLPGPQRWRLLDNDAGLLEQAAAAAFAVRDATGGPVEVETCLTDLAAPGWEALAGGADLLTCSALLDLAGLDVIGRIAAAAAGRAAVLAVLSVDGRDAIAPEDPLDAELFAAFHAHMRRDKGLGPALGSLAPEALAGRLERAGYGVVTARSDWQIDAAREPALARELLTGWVAAVRETGRIDPAALDGWASRRLAAAAAGSLHLRVGHLDLLALPG